MNTRAATLDGIEPIERQVIRRIAWRLMPLLALGYFCAYLDRANVGMAAPTMSPDLGFSNAVFGFGAGLFFFGCCLAEIPSNLILDRYGARRWIARILVSWGIVSGLTAFVWDDWSFYIVRFLLGLAEAGFYPGVVLYLIWWFPSHYRTRMMAIFQSASVVSLFVGPPVSGLLLYLHGLLGLRGWQWLYIAEALPAVVMGFVVWYLLTDRPGDATWLDAEQKQWLNQRLAAERAQREAVRKYSLAESFTSGKVWLLTVAHFGYASAGYGLTFFMPLIVKGLGVSSDLLGVVSAAPYLCSFVVMIWLGWHSDRTGERTWHVAGTCLACAVGLAAGVFIGTGHPVVSMLALTLAVVAQQSIAAIFWSIPSALLTGSAAAGGIAVINAVGNLGGWYGPTLYGLVKDATGSTNLGLLCLAAGAVVAAVCVIIVGHDPRQEPVPTRRP